SRGVTGCSLQLDSRSHPARRSLLPGHPAGDGDLGLRSGGSIGRREKHMKRVRRSPVLGAVAAWLAAVVPAPAGTLKCPPDSVKVGNASASCSSGGRRSRATPSSVCSSLPTSLCGALWDRV